MLTDFLRIFLLAVVEVSLFSMALNFLCHIPFLLLFFRSQSLFYAGKHARLQDYSICDIA